MCHVYCAVQDRSTCRFCLCRLCPRAGSRPLSSILLRLVVSTKTFRFLNIYPEILFFLFGWIERSLVLVCSFVSFLYVFCVHHFYAIFWPFCVEGAEGVGVGVRSWTYMISHIFSLQEYYTRFSGGMQIFSVAKRFVFQFEILTS